MPTGPYGYGYANPSTYGQGPQGGVEGFFDFSCAQYGYNYSQNQNDDGDEGSNIQPGRHSTWY